MVAFVLEHIAGIVWPKTKSGGFVLPCRSTVLSHLPTLSVLNDMQIAEAILAQARDVGAAGGHKVLDFHAAMSADGCTTNGSQFESLVLRFGEQQFALSAPSNALGSTAEHKFADIEGGFARLRAVTEELLKVTRTDVNGCEHVDPKHISPCIVSSMTTDSAAAERRTAELLADFKRAELPAQLGEEMADLLDDLNPRVFASVAATGGRVRLSLKVFAREPEAEEPQRGSQADDEAAERLLRFKKKMGQWRVDSLPEAERTSLGEVVWINCLMHATVHGVDAMMDKLNSRLVAALGPDRMETLRSRQTGTSAKSAGEGPAPHWHPTPL